MSDAIRGRVTEIIDGDTFILELTHTARGNVREYDEEEKIRLFKTDAPKGNTVAGKKAKQALKRQYAGKKVCCDIKARDTYGRLICDVKVI